MIWIIDDTFKTTALETSKWILEKGWNDYNARISSEFYEEDLAKLAEELKNYSAIACHRSLRFMSKRTGQFLPSERNLRLFERMEFEIRNSGVLYISFSGQINETQIHHDHFVSMNKRDFYALLKDLLDHYAENSRFEIKVLKFGRHFIGNELLGIVNAFSSIRNKYPECESLRDLIVSAPAARQALELYQKVSKIKSDSEEWLSLLHDSYDNLSMLKPLLDKITKSFLKYGRCIYSI